MINNKTITFLLLICSLTWGEEKIHLEPSDMIRLRKANFSDSFLSAVQKQGYLYTSIGEMIKLRKRNISENVIMEYVSQPLKVESEDLLKLRKANFSDPFLLSIITRGYSQVISINEMIRLRKNRVSFRQILDYCYPEKNSEGKESK